MSALAMVNRFGRTVQQNSKVTFAILAEIEAVKKAASLVAAMPLRIRDSADMNLNQVAAYAGLSIRQHGTKLFCVDYAQNVEAIRKPAYLVQRMVLRHTLLQRHITEHPVVQPLVSTHTP